MASLAGGWIVLLTLLVGETDEAFADIYSAAVSAQNLRERLRQRRAILAVAAVGVGLAVWLNSRGADATSSFELFLFLLGSVFVPLFGVFVADYFLLPRTSVGSVSARSLRPAAFVAWVVGFLVYQWSVPTGPAGWQSAMQTLFHDWLRLPFPLAGSAAGASLPSFATALVLYVVLRRLGARRAGRRIGLDAPATP
jgi:purine-cytosine permease-like protein